MITGWIGLTLVAIAATTPATGILINEDNSHFYGGRSPEQMTLEGLNAFVDQYAGAKVAALFLNPNAMRASYATDVWDRIWEAGDQTAPTDDGHGGTWYRNARLLFERGLDPYAVWIARCREKGISPWITSRMNDVHDVSDPKNFMHSTFWVKHPEFWRVPNDASGSWTNRALDFAHPEVRDRHTALLKEMLERYDIDGLELDWMRFGYHFAPGQEEAGRLILNEYMRQIRAITQEAAAKRGHPIKLGARVPTHPDAAVGLGMDGVTWAREGLIDMLVPTPFWATGDFDIPIEFWRERIGPEACAKIVLAAGHEILLRAHPSGKQIENDIESVRGFAAGALHRGADQIYLFNYMDPAPMTGGPEAYRTLIEDGLSWDVVTTKPRRHIVTYRDTVPAGVSNNAQLPANTKDAPKFRIYTGPVPKAGTAVFLAGLSESPDAAKITLTASLNGQPCQALPDAENLQAYPGVVRALQFDAPLGALKEGYNEIALTQPADQPGDQIIWAQIRIVPAP